MDQTRIALTPSEWQLMECLWERAPRTGREATEDLRVRAGWSRSTTLTMLRRMTEKGLLACDSEGGALRYRPLVRRKDAVREETRSFLNRVYRGSVGLLVSAMAEQQALSQEDLDALRAILQQAEEKS